MELNNYDTLIQSRAQTVSDALQSLSPYDRAIVLNEAQCKIDDHDGGNARELCARDAEVTKAVLIANWLGHVVDKLGPEARRQLVQYAEGLDNEARLEGMMSE